MEDHYELSRFGNGFKERVERALDCLKNGKGVLVVDDESRENEGDLIFPAETMTVADMALMIRECSGIICLCLKPAKVESLELQPMVQVNTSKFHTPFTVTIEAKEGVTTGVSAADRIQTIRTAISDQAKPSDLSRPGHVFPLRANEDGVFGRRGHTEGSVDLMVLAGLRPAAVLCELTNEDGTMARLPEIAAFAVKRESTVVSIEDIFQYRLALKNL
ncbi:3,4-dihydroxy-2-butanone-4-phosphate synthase [Pedobacter cryoconitis]|uniref:3,4-dihydroxy-2-butanone 4-phosphate synthase n=1 Tax=Pedobacter cryoconitis TaxID=188932 RepID=A0A7X0MIN0_9SPHI|nr:3,4-dihydroxy-2-butanone-4-phosphate synthase [Pedobacter cryoconitis]MBB6500101.1 3,4-dihydroxy 2-butanone 4-phosphate synthase [Pedobacter cryoconitis]